MTQGQNLLFCIGANHKTCGFELREKLFLTQDEIARALPHLKAEYLLKECLVLSTCNRLELYGTIGLEAQSDEHIFAAFSALHRFGRHEDVEQSTLHDTCYVHFGPTAVKHAFAVCAGLDSLVIGETQITGQFKEATQVAREQETLGQVLSRVSQDALATAKKIRSQTDIGKKTVSISHAAIDLANQIYGAVNEHRVAIIGAGEMGSLAARYTVRYMPRRLFIVNRTYSRAEALVAELNSGTAHPMEQLEDILRQSDIIITSTASEKPIINSDMVKRVQALRNHKPILFVDISLPRNVAHDISQIDDVYLFDIDDLKQVVESHGEERRQAAEKAFGIAEESSKAFMRWLSTLDVKPALANFKQYLDQLLRKESQRTLSRELFKSLSDSQHDAIQTMLASIAQKIVSDAGTHVRQPPDGYYPTQLAETLSVLFPKVASQEESHT